MRYAMSEEIIAIRLTEGEKLHENIARVCEESSVDSAVVLGAAGMVREIRFGWFNGNDYEIKDFDGVFELISLTGDVSIKGQEIYPHLHASFSRPDHSTVGGHVLNVVANNNLEIFLKPLTKIRFAREFDGWFEALVPLKR
ncbi:MAG: DUF296 domain-containing protein [Synergistales bacterium]|nr:DUF296 domain-containing protein [Synergistales bacterium]